MVMNLDSKQVQTQTTTLECISLVQYISEEKEICVWSSQSESCISRCIFQLIHSITNAFANTFGTCANMWSAVIMIDLSSG
jgi:hypothetical protein